MNKLSKDKRDKIILVGLLTLTLSFGVWYLVIRSQSATLKDIAKQIDDSRAKVQRGELTVKSAPKVEADFQQATDQLKQRESTLAAGDMYAWLIQTVNRFRAAYKVEIPNYSREVAAEVGLFPK